MHAAKSYQIKANHNTRLAAVLPSQRCVLLGALMALLGMLRRGGRAAGIMAAVMNVAWPISTEYGEESRYNTLLQISIGQEEVDEVITRDIHRTFPEHPQFGFAQGQQALFRILKAYSLHDLEVCPCPCLCLCL